MDESKKKRVRARRRDLRVRARMMGTAEKPRLSVFRSNKQISVQLIDDIAGRTIAAASSLSSEIDVSVPGGIAVATEVGKAIGRKAREADVKSCVFDRGRYRYHGRVKALADGAREEGLRF